MKKALWGSKKNMNFTIKMELKNAWQHTVKMLMKSVKGVTSFKMDKDEKNFTIKVELKNAWQDTVKMVITSVEGVTSFKMDNNGKVHISGYIDPTRLLSCLKKAGRKAEMVHWQYGECSKNLFHVTEQPSNDIGNGAGFLYPDFNNGYGNENEYGYGNGNGYGYEYVYPRYESNYAYKHLECSGNAEDCDGHHIKLLKN